MTRTSLSSFCPLLLLLVNGPTTGDPIRSEVEGRRLPFFLRNFGRASFFFLFFHLCCRVPAFVHQRGESLLFLSCALRSNAFKGSGRRNLVNLVKKGEREERGDLCSVDGRKKSGLPTLQTGSPDLSGFFCSSAFECHLFSFLGCQQPQTLRK